MTGAPALAPLRAPRLDAVAGIRHGFFGREGGVSPAPHRGAVHAGGQAQAHRSRRQSTFEARRGC
ncbi:MAG: hypothetical protein AAFU58_09020, partial [Pseudomonadota bacterium]